MHHLNSDLHCHRLSIITFASFSWSYHIWTIFNVQLAAIFGYKKYRKIYDLIRVTRRNN
jgi:hypothetical protein